MGEYRVVVMRPATTVVVVEATSETEAKAKAKKRADKLPEAAWETREAVGVSAELLRGRGPAWDYVNQKIAALAQRRAELLAALETGELDGQPLKMDKSELRGRVWQLDEEAGVLSMLSSDQEAVAYMEDSEAEPGAEGRHSASCPGCLPTPSGTGVYVGRHESFEPVMGNPLFPHGQCPACGTGVNWAGQCQAPECSSYVPGADDEVDE